MRSDASSVQQSSYDLAFDGRLLFRIMWQARLTLLIFICSAAIMSVAFSLLLPNVYRAEAYLMPNSDGAGGGLSGIAAQYGAIASLTGINLTDGSSDKTALGIAVLQSRKFIIEFIARRDIKVNLMATSGWNEESRSVVIDNDIYNESQNKWVRRSWFGKEGEPSLLESYEEFIEILQVRQEGDTGFVRLSIDHYSPAVASNWVQWLVQDLNSIVMSQDVAEAKQSINYLENQINNTSLSELRIVFSNLIEKQLEVVMLSEVTDEYLFKTIDPAMEPERKHRPNRALIGLLGMLLGALLGGFFALVRHSRND